MLDITIQCDCGQRYKFDVESAAGQMPFAVWCPMCGRDGTGKAELLLQEKARSQAGSPPLPPVAATGRPKLRLSSTPPLAPEPAAMDAVIAPPVSQEPAQLPVPAAGAMTVAESPAPAAAGLNLGLGILGAVLGAGVGAGFIFGFFTLTGLKFPLLGVGIGVLAGFGARVLYRGTGVTLGLISAVVALVSVVGTLYMMFGALPMLNIVSLIVSVGMAYRVAAG